MLDQAQEQCKTTIKSIKWAVTSLRLMELRRTSIVTQRANLIITST